jgi:hypothetical protein
MLSKRDSLRRKIEALEAVFGVHEGSPRAVDFSREERTEIMKKFGYEQVAIIPNEKRKYLADIDPYALNRKELLVWLRERGWARAHKKRK